MGSNQISLSFFFAKTTRKPRVRQPSSRQGLLEGRRERRIWAAVVLPQNGFGIGRYFCVSSFERSKSVVKSNTVGLLCARVWKVSSKHDDLTRTNVLFDLCIFKALSFFLAKVYHVQIRMGERILAVNISPTQGRPKVAWSGKKKKIHWFSSLRILKKQSSKWFGG